MRKFKVGEKVTLEVISSHSKLCPKCKKDSLVWSNPMIVTCENCKIIFLTDSERGTWESEIEEDDHQYYEHASWQK